MATNSTSSEVYTALYIIYSGFKGYWALHVVTYKIQSLRVHSERLWTVNDEQTQSANGPQTQAQMERKRKVNGKCKVNDMWTL